MKSAEQNEKCWTKLLVGKKCFISNLLIKNAERRENGVKARVKKTDAARISSNYGVSKNEHPRTAYDPTFLLQNPFLL